MSTGNVEQALALGFVLHVRGELDDAARVYRETLAMFPNNSEACVPVVTLVGNTVVGRAGYSQLKNLDLPELIASTTEAFADVATRLAADRVRLGELRRTLRSRMERSRLMDAKRFARDVEAAYGEMWRHWCAEPLPGLSR